jgi:hypothetical protein
MPHFPIDRHWVEADQDRILEVDEFIAELWQVHLKVKEEGYVQVYNQFSKDHR